MKKLLFLVFSILSISSASISAQDYISRDDLSDKEKRIYRKAIDATRSQQYVDAIKYFDDVLKKEPNFPEAYLRKGSIHYNLKEFDEAKDEFLHAISIAPEFDPEMYYSAGLALHALKEYDKAAYHFEAYLARDGGNARKKAKAQKLMINSRFAHEAVNHPVPFDPVKMSDAVNSDNSEYTPMASIDGESLIFTRRIGRQEDFYISRKDSIGEYTLAKEITGLNTPDNEGAHTISADGKFMVFTACDRRDSEGGCDLYYSQLIDDEWTGPINMGPVINTPAWESQPSLSADGQLLYFTSNRKGGLGGKDIWVSVRSGERNGWSLPINLGAPVNTVGNDESPFIHADGYTLYFRSDSHPGMGDFDMYVARRGENPISWSNPENLGYPINTIGDEGALTVSLDGKTAYFASDMAYLDDMSKANLDLYSFELPVHARPRLSTFLKVNVIDAITKVPIEVSNIQLTNAEDGSLLSKYKTDANGSFTTSLPTGATYALAIESDKYLFQSRFFDLDSVFTKVDPYIITIALMPIPIGQSTDMVYDTPTVLNNIFFETGSAQLKNVSTIEISRLAKTLKENPSLKIKIMGHTDNVGDASANQKLSEERARSVYEALVNQGVSATRLSYAGLGETTPVDTNDSPEGRQKNRRTEFILIR